MDFMQYILEANLIFIPVLYIVGIVLKNLMFVNDKYIPLILLVVSILLNIAESGVNTQAIIQAVLLVGATVYGNQVYKQLFEK